MKTTRFVLYSSYSDGTRISGKGVHMYIGGFDLLILSNFFNITHENEKNII